MDILDLPGLIAVSEKTDEATKTRIIHAEISNQGPQARSCPYCGKGRLLRHGKRTLKYRDVPIREFRVIISLSLQKYRCKHCKKIISQTASGFDQKRSLTTRCIEWIRQHSLETSFSNVARESGCSQNTVRDIAYEYINSRSEEYRPSMPQWLGIDEVFQSRNRQFCVFSDLEHRRVIDIVPNCNLRTIMAWLANVGKHQPPHGVCIDMCPRHRTAVERIFPNTEIMVDKCYLLKLADSAMDRVVRAVEAKYYSERRPIGWKRQKALLRKRKEALDPIERMSLKSWLSLHHEIEVAYRLRVAFFEIYNQKERQDAQIALERWERSVPEDLRSAFRVLLAAVRNWRKQILAYFERPESITYAGWPLSRIRSTRRLSKGCSFEVLRGRLLFDRKHEPAHHPLAA
jgi:transposase